MGKLNPNEKRTYVVCPKCEKGGQFNIEWVADKGTAWQEINCCQCGFKFTPADIWNLEKGFTLPPLIEKAIDEYCEKCALYEEVAQSPFPDWYLKGNVDAKVAHLEKDHK